MSAAVWLTDQILIVRNLFSPAECREFINMAENQYGFQTASVRAQGGPQMRPDIRDNERSSFHDEAIATAMWIRIREHLPHDDQAEPIGVDSFLRVYKFTGDQRFKRHKDGVAVGDDGATSRYSYLLYLNDDMQGGETVFTFVTRGQGVRRDETLTVRPEVGMALLFIHQLWHEGTPVRQGVKYVLRSDVFYQSRT